MNEDMRRLYTHQRFIFITLDPVHIGTGGYGLGRVDNPIVREPGTNLPKIPGTSLMGAVRNYAAMCYEKLSAAGQHKNFKGDKNKCPIIYTFGTATETGGGQAGKISIGDVQILFFPVYSLAGPIWISTKEIVTEVGFTFNNKDTENDIAFTTLSWRKDTLNLGWLLFKIKEGLKLNLPFKFKKNREWEAISNRIVLVSQKLFSQIVNSNLEIRTSVAINPETGAAEEKALFTYEALSRATWLWCDIIEDDYDYEVKFPLTEKQFKDGKENNGEILGKAWQKPLDVVKAGINLLEYFGIGGMSTRGFGRIKLINDWEVVKNES